MDLEKPGLPFEGLVRAAPGMAAYPMKAARTVSGLYELWLDLSPDPFLVPLPVSEGACWGSALSTLRRHQWVRRFGGSGCPPLHCRRNTYGRSILRIVKPYASHRFWYGVRSCCGKVQEPWGSQLVLQWRRTVCCCTLGNPVFHAPYLRFRDLGKAREPWLLNVEAVCKTARCPWALITLFRMTARTRIALKR